MHVCSGSDFVTYTDAIFTWLNAALCHTSTVPQSILKLIAVTVHYL